jgi:T5SS/PEP-CTERM-associated repeat protein
VPNESATNADIAIFDRAEAYTIDVGTRHNERLIVRNGNVIFEDGAYLVDGLSFDPASVVIDNARLHLLTKMFLTNNYALIGESAASRVDIGFGGVWVSLGSLSVGGPGNGILNIDAGGTNISAGSRIGTGAGGGTAIINQDGSWTTGNLAIGAGGQGELTIQAGGKVYSEEALIGQEPGLGNKVTVTGVGNNGTNSEWDVLDTLQVGSAGDAMIEISEGGRVAVLSLQIGQGSTGTGSLKVSGVHPTGGRSLLRSATGILVREGSLAVEDGALVEAAKVEVGSPGASSVQVVGLNAATGTRSTAVTQALRLEKWIFSAWVAVLLRPCRWTRTWTRAHSAQAQSP